MKRLTAALIVTNVALGSAAEPTMIEDTEKATVFRERDQVVVLAADGRLGQLVNLSQERAPGDLPQVLGSKRMPREIRDLGVKVFITRIRQLDGELVCEKLAGRPAPEHRSLVVSWLLEQPC